MWVVGLGLQTEGAVEKGFEVTKLGWRRQVSMGFRSLAAEIRV